MRDVWKGIGLSAACGVVAAIVAAAVLVHYLSPR
jgi:hypothetical protein